MTYSVRLSGSWSVCPTSSDARDARFNPAAAFTIPECRHLQPFLYPENPYWGKHVREMNHRGWLYEYAFSVPAVQFSRARLHFEAVDYFAAVWLNDTLLGHHEGSFNAFTFEATHALKRHEQNCLRVHVSSPWDVVNPRGTYPLDHVLRNLVKGLYEHGEGVLPPDVNPLGIWRPVWLVLDDGMSIDGVQIRAEMDGNLQLQATISSTIEWSGELALEVAAENHDGIGAVESVPVTITPGVQTIEYQMTLSAPQLWWSWDHGLPNLYRLTLRLGESRHSEVFGFRSVRLERNRERFIYWLNERPVYIRGTSYMPGLYLSQHDRDSLGRDVSLAQKANLNLLRVHVHVSPVELYDICDRVGMLVWQDFELNWMQETTVEFETRARRLQRDMLSQLGNHPSIVTWACHNEPTMIFFRRGNLERHPDPVLYADAVAQDSSRPVFMCSGQLEEDWQRAGDVHTYWGALWSKRYTDVYRHHPRLNSEFGLEAPCTPSTMQLYPEVWERLKHLLPQLDTIWNYQAELIQFHVEHFRLLRSTTNAGYIHFWLLDPVPQVGCGVLDSMRLPKGGFEALRLASQPLHVAMQHDGHRAYALWVFNDTTQEYTGTVVCYEIYDEANQLLFQGSHPFDITANASQQVLPINWRTGHTIKLSIVDAANTVLARNHYTCPFQPALRPAGYPWKFDPVLGTKVYNRPNAPSLADVSTHPALRLIPLFVREWAAEWMMRQRLPLWLVSWIARVGDRLNR